MGDASICEIINPKYTTDINMCNALAKKDIGYCNKITDAYRSSMCKIFLGVNEKVCDGIAKNSQKGECYRESAIIQGNPSLCEKAKNAEKSEHYWCLARVGNKIRDSSVCSEIDDEFERIYCVALSENNLQECEKITDKKMYDSCVRNIIRIKNTYFKNY